MSSGPDRLGRRLRRILLMLPYAIQHPGVTVDELAHKFGVRRREIVDDLELLFLCGLPGYGPGDLIDVSVTDDRVFVRMADYFAEPLRLSPAEALSLYTAGRALVELPEMEEADALRRALGKLGRALGLGNDRDPAISLRLQPGPTEHLATLHTSLRDKRRVRLEYLSASKGELTEREVEPWGLILAWGRSYLVGWDHLSQDERVFRIDRIKAVDLRDEPVEVPPDFDPQRYRRAFAERPDERTISLEISPAVARWFADYYPVRSAAVVDDGWQRVEMAAESDRWAATLLLRLGTGARAVDPPSIVTEARSLARKLAQAHAPGGEVAG